MTNTGGEKPVVGEGQERVPLFGSWSNAYIVVIAVLVADMVLLYICTRLLS